MYLIFFAVIWSIGELLWGRNGEDMVDSMRVERKKMGKTNKNNTAIKKM